MCKLGFLSHFVDLLAPVSYPPAAYTWALHELAASHQRCVVGCQVHLHSMFIPLRLVIASVAIIWFHFPSHQFLMSHYIVWHWFC